LLRCPSTADECDPSNPLLATVDAQRDAIESLQVTITLLREQLRAKTEALAIQRQIARSSARLNSAFSRSNP